MDRSEARKASETLTEIFENKSDLNVEAVHVTDDDTIFLRLGSDRPNGDHWPQITIIMDYAPLEFLESVRLLLKKEDHVRLSLCKVDYDNVRRAVGPGATSFIPGDKQDS